MSPRVPPPSAHLHLHHHHRCHRGHRGHRGNRRGHRRPSHDRCRHRHHLPLPLSPPLPLLPAISPTSCATAIDQSPPPLPPPQVPALHCLHHSAALTTVLAHSHAAQSSACTPLHSHSSIPAAALPQLPPGHRPPCCHAHAHPMRLDWDAGLIDAHLEQPPSQLLMLIAEQSPTAAAAPIALPLRRCDGRSSILTPARQTPLRSTPCTPRVPRAWRHRRARVLAASRLMLWTQRRWSTMPMLTSVIRQA